MISATHTHSMVLDIALGRRPEQARLAPLSAEHLVVSDRLAVEIAEILAAGRIVDIPLE